MLCSKTFAVFFTLNFICVIGLTTLIPLSEAQITRENFLTVLINALENDWDFETDRIDVEIKKVELESSKRKYSGLKLDLKASHEIDEWERWRTTTSNSPYIRKQWHENSAYQITTSKQFLNNPSKLSLSYKRDAPWNRYERYKKFTFHDDYQTQDYESTVEIEWKIPLMRHTNNASDLKTYRRNRLDLIDQKIAYLEHKESFVYDRFIEFYQVALLQEQLSLIKTYISLLEAIVLIDASHILPVERAIFDYQNHYDALLREKNSLTKELSLRLDYPAIIDQAIRLILKTTFVPVTNLSDYLEKHNRELKHLDIDRRLKAIDITYLKNQTQADLDLYFLATHSTDNGNTLSTEFDERRNDYGVFLEFKLPIIGYRSSETSLTIAQLNLEKIQHKYKRKKQDLIAEIESLEQSIVQASKNLSSYDLFIQSSIKNRKQEAINYQENTSSIQDYLQALENEFEAYESQLIAKIEFQEELLKYDDLLDRLITEKHHSP